MSRREILADTLARLTAERYQPRPSWGADVPEPRPRRRAAAAPRRRPAPAPGAVPELTPAEQLRNREVLAAAVGGDPDLTDDEGTE